MFRKIFGTFILLVILFLFTFIIYQLNSSENSGVFVKEKSEILVKDGNAYLYKIKEEIEDKEKGGGRFWYVATNQKLEGINFHDQIQLEKVSENIFWDPENCAQMFTLSGGNDLYFFESRFKLNSSNEFYDVIYRFKVKENQMETFENQTHINIYSVIFDDQKIKVFYKNNDTQKFYMSELEELENKINYTNTKEIKEEDIIYRDWKGNLEALDKIEGLIYFVIQ